MSFTFALGVNKNKICSNINANGIEDLKLNHLVGTNKKNRALLLYVHERFYFFNGKIGNYYIYGMNARFSLFYFESTLLFSFLTVSPISLVS